MCFVHRAACYRSARAASPRAREDPRNRRAIPTPLERIKDLKAYPSWVGMPTVEHQRRLSIHAIFGRLAGWSGNAATPTTLIHPHHFRSSIRAWRLAGCNSNRSSSPSPPPLHATYNKLARLHPKLLPPSTQHHSPPHHTRQDLMHGTMVSLVVATR